MIIVHKVAITVLAVGLVWLVVAQRALNRLAPPPWPVATCRISCQHLVDLECCAHECCLPATRLCEARCEAEGWTAEERDCVATVTACKQMPWCLSSDP